MAGKKKVVAQPESEAQEELAAQLEQSPEEVKAAEVTPVEEVKAEEPAQPVEEVKEQPEKASAPKKKGNKVAAGCKEWFRKRIVGLKRSPQSIVLVALFITTAIWLIWLFTFSRAISVNIAAEWVGLVVFINTLVSILIIALFGSAFPKRKKPNIVFIILLFVFMAAIIACDVIYNVQMSLYIKYYSNLSSEQLAKAPYINKSLNYAIAHAVLVGVCAVLLATLPLYKRLINKINNKKEIATNEMNEVIDVEED